MRRAVAGTAESSAVALGRRGSVRAVPPRPQVECPFCKGMYPDLSWHYAVGPNTCPELAHAWDEDGRVDPNTLPCHRCGDPKRAKNRPYCKKCCKADAQLARARKKNK